MALLVFDCDVWADFIQSCLLHSATTTTTAAATAAAAATTITTTTTTDIFIKCKHLTKRTEFGALL